MGLASWFYLNSEKKKLDNNFPPRYDILDKPKDLSKITIKLLSIPDTGKIYEIIGYDELQFGQIFYVREAHPNPSEFFVYKTFIKEDIDSMELEFIDLTIEGEGHSEHSTGNQEQITLTIKEAFNVVANELANNNDWVWTEEINLGNELEKEKFNKTTDSFEYQYLLGEIDE